MPPGPAMSTPQAQAKGEGKAGKATGNTGGRVVSLTDGREYAITGSSLVFGRVTAETPLILESRMAENGVIFSDGIENDFLEFNSGTQAVIGIAERKGVLVE